MSVAPESAAAPRRQTSATASTQKSAPPWESPEWQEAVRQNPGLEPFFDNLESFVELPEGIKKLREMILRLAVRGQLTEGMDGDEDAAELRASIIEKRQLLAKEYSIRSKQEEGAIQKDSLPFHIPKTWAWIRLGEFGVFFGGGTPSKQNAEYWAGPIPWVSPKDMKRPKIADAQDHVSQSAVDNSSAKMIPTGALLMVVRGMILDHSFPVAISQRELTINQDMKALALVSPEMGDFLLLMCAGSKQRMLERVQRSSHGTCRLATDDVANFPVPLPPLAEQRRIVSKVEGLMSLCDTLESYRRARESVRERASRSVLASLTSAPRVGSQVSGEETLASAWQRLSDHFEVLLDQPEMVPHLRQSVLQLAVQGKLVPQDPSDEPVSELIETIKQEKAELIAAKKIKRSNLHTGRDRGTKDGALPFGWLWTIVDDLTSIGTGTTPPKGNQEYYQGGTIPWITSASTNNEFIEEPPGFVTELAVKERNMRLYPKGSLVVALYGQGKTRGQVGQLMFDSTSNQANAVLEFFRTGWECRDYFRLVFQKKYHELRELAAGGAQPNLSGGLIRLTKIPLPPLAEQKRIVSKVSVLLSQCDELSSRLRSSQSSTDALLTALIHQILEGVSDNE